MEVAFDQLDDRRSAPRVETDLPILFSDYAYEWEGRCISISFQGCFIRYPEPFGEGKELALKLTHPDGDELQIDAIVRWAREDSGRLPAGMGVVFDLRDRRLIELTTDFVERLALEDVVLATRYRDALRPMSIVTVMHFARGAPENPVLTDAERTFMAWVDGERNLRSIREAVGPETWELIRFAPFSLRGKGVLTTDKSLAGEPPTTRRAGGPARPAGAAEVASRNAQAHRHYENALDALETNDERRALTELRLALMLAPGDPEISDLLNRLEED
ncbi:MAG: PilZ domain-containing protein [Myxococcota bacterium]